MKKKFFDLQLFADESGTGAETGSGTETTTEQTTEQSTEQKQTGKADEKKYSDADFDRLFNKKFAELEQKKKKEIDEAKELANMNAQQKAEHERDELQKQLDDFKRRDALSEMTKTARKMLSDEGINASDELLAVMVTTDAKQTKNAIDSFSKLFKSAVESAVKEQLKGGTPKKSTGTGTGSMTKDQIMKISDQELRQQKIIENKHLFNM